MKATNTPVEGCITLCAERAAGRALGFDDGGARRTRNGRPRCASKQTAIIATAGVAVGIGLLAVVLLPISIGP